MPPRKAATTRRSRRAKKPGVTISDAIRLLTEAHGPFENEPRLDPAHELTFTILSQHTSDRNSERAFRSLMTALATSTLSPPPMLTKSSRLSPAAGWPRSKRPALRPSLTRYWS